MVTTLTISTTGSTPSTPKTLEISEIFSGRHVKNGYLTFSSISGSALTAAQQAGDTPGDIPHVVNYWITPDNMLVTGSESRTLGSITSHNTIKWAKTPGTSNTITPYNS